MPAQSWLLYYASAYRKTIMEKKFSPQAWREVEVEATNQQPAEVTCQMLRSRPGADVPLAILWNQQKSPSPLATTYYKGPVKPANLPRAPNITSAHPAAIN